VQALILAGGRGRRLEPYTTHIPKPLMPIGDIPILEILVRQLSQNGVSSIIMAVGYLHHMIESYFKNGEQFDIDIRYSLEENPLGTAGPINLVLNHLEDDFLILNGDILTDLNFSELFDAHIKHDADVTIATYKRTVDIDFGVIESNANSELEDYKEKPSFNFLVSMGVNVLKKSSILPFVEREGYLDLPDLILKLKESKKKVFCAQQTCEWLDIGRPVDYNIAIDLFKKRKEIFLPDE